jgi:nucleoside-diphosphate-sugar epimerase
MNASAPARIAVTGATGFTGPFVVRGLAARFPAASIRCFVRPGSRRDVLDGLPVEFAEGDLRDGASLDRALDGCDAIVHVASLGFDWVDPLFDAIGRHGTVRRGVFVSTTAILTTLAVRSRPLREHGEARVRASGLAWTIVRPTMIYGTPGDRNIARLIRFIERSPIVPVIAPEARQQPVHVADVADGIVAALSTPAAAGQTYTLSGAAPITFETLVRETIRATGRRRLVLRLPFWPVRAGVRLLNAAPIGARVSVEQVDRLREDKAFDHDAAARDLGYRPRPFAEGVAAEVPLVRAAARV